MTTRKNYYHQEEHDKLRGEFTSWLDTMLKRARARYLRTAESPFETVSIDSLQELPDEGNPYESIERSPIEFDFQEARLAEAFRTLSLLRREILRLLFVEEMTPSEISKILHCSENVIYQHKHKAIKRLRAILEEGDDIL